MKLLMITILAAFLSSGCVSQSSIDKAIDQKIAANNVAFVQPMMAQQNLQIRAVQADVTRNKQAILKSTAQVSVHQDVLVDHYMQQQHQAAAALMTLSPEPAPITQAAPIVTDSAVPAPVSAAAGIPETVTSTTSD